MRDDVPLSRTGVLRFIDQQMVDAAVELEMHPAGGDAIQHRKGLVDQIVVIEQPALLLFAAVVRGGLRGDDQQRLRAVADHQRAALFDQRKSAGLFLVEEGGKWGLDASQRSVDQPRTRQVFGIKKNTNIAVSLFADIRRCESFAKARRLILIRRAAGVEDRRNFLPMRSRQIWPVDNFALDVVEPRAPCPRCRAMPKNGPGSDTPRPPRP